MVYEIHTRRGLSCVRKYDLKNCPSTILAYILCLLQQTSSERVDRVENLERCGWWKDSFKRCVFGKNQCRDTVVGGKRNQKVIDLDIISCRNDWNIYYDSLL